MMQGLSVGERIPNFRRLDGEGVVQHLHNDLHVGQSIVLWIVRDTSDSGLGTCFRQLKPADPFWQSVTTLCLMPAEPAAAKALADQHEIRHPVLADDGSLIQFLAGDQEDDPLLVLALDRRLRVLQRLGIPSTRQDVISTLRAAYSAENAGTQDGVVGAAPVLLIPRVFEPEFCTRLIERFDHEGGQSSGVIVHENGKQILKPDPETKDRSDYYFQPNDALFQQLRQRVLQRVLPEIQQYFNYTVTAHDPFRLICYDSATGGYFRPHRDNVTEDVAHRKFALTVNLNADEYEGGELQFAEFGDQLYKPETGAAVVFSCAMVHEAMPVTEGKRYAVVSFFYSDKDS